MRQQPRPTRSWPDGAAEDLPTLVPPGRSYRAGPSGPTMPMTPVRAPHRHRADREGRRVGGEGAIGLGTTLTEPAVRPVDLPPAERPTPRRQTNSGGTGWWSLGESPNFRAWYWIIVAGCAVVLQLILYTNSGYSWHYFTDGAALLVGQHPAGMTLPGGLHLYANYPQLQIGPLALLAAVGLEPFDATGGWLISVWLMTLAGLLALYLVERAIRITRPSLLRTPRATALTMIIGGGSFIASWELLAVHFGHLDDVLALLMLAGAVHAVARRNPVLAGVCVGLAADAKPWALACAALLLAFPMRQWWRAMLPAVIVVCVAWLPFVLADPHTLSAAAFTIPNVPASGLRALGVNTPGTPSWDREAQIGIGCLLGAVALARHRWEAIFALGIGARIALDPSDYAYYTAGLALGLLAWDLVGYRKPIPVLSSLCFLGLTVAGFVLKDDGAVQGELRLWTVLIATAVMLLVPRHDDERFGFGPFWSWLSRQRAEGRAPNPRIRQPGQWSGEHL